MIDARREYVEEFAKGFVEGYLESYQEYSELYPNFFGEDDAEGKIPFPVQVARNGFRSLPKALQAWLIGLSREQFRDAVRRMFRYQSAEAFWDDLKKSDLAVKS